jgi:hypothetical protein
MQIDGAGGLSLRAPRALCPRPDALLRGRDRVLSSTPAYAARRGVHPVRAALLEGCQPVPLVWPAQDARPARSARPAVRALQPQVG